MLNNKGIISKAMLLAILLLLVLVGIVWLLVVKLEGAAPEIRLAELPSALGVSQELTVTVSDQKSGLQNAWVGVVQGKKEIVLLEKTYPKKNILGEGAVKEDTVTLSLEPKKIGLIDGEATLKISVRDRSWRKWWHGSLTTFEKLLPVDTRVPQIEVMSDAHNINQGGAGLIVYRLSESCSKSGVMVGDNFFPGMSGYFPDPLVHLCFFALRHDQGADTPLSLEADDAAGNHGKIGFMHHIRAKVFKKDTITITDQFLEAKLPEFDLSGTEAGTGSLLEKFLKVNRDVRADNFKTIMGVTAVSDPVLRWQGAFSQLPNSANRASFAQERTYMYNGSAVDLQTHLGIDLASLAHSPVPASNAGKVACGERIGIYGNVVILDHGFGLFSLYSHLSDIAVTAGQEVQKGDTIGHTGTTGWAGGDHLHFSMILHNIFVDPLEWLDSSWIENNVTSKLGQEGAPASTAAASTTTTP